MSAREFGDRDHVPARQPTALRGDARVVQPALLLRVDADVRAVGRDGNRRRLAVQKRAAQTPFEFFAEAPRPPLAEQELEPRARARVAVAVVAEEGADVRADLDRLVRADVRAEAVGEALLRAEAAADPQIEHDLAVRAPQGDEADVRDLVAGAVERAARNRDLELARQVRELAVVEEVVVHGERQRLGVDELVRRDAGERAARDVARDVAAGARGREADAAQLLEDGGHVLDADVVELNVLPRRHVAGVPRVDGGDAAQRLQLLARQSAVRHLDAEHEVAVLLRALRVEAVPAQAHVEVVLGDGLEALARVAQDVFETVERVALALDAFRLRLFLHDRHRLNNSPKNKNSRAKK